EVIDGSLLMQAEADFVDQNAEFRPDWISQFARDETERDAERMSGAETANDNIDRLWKLLAEPVNPARPRVPQDQVSGQQGGGDRHDDRQRPELEPECKRQVKHAAQRRNPNKHSNRIDFQSGLHDQLIEPPQPRHIAEIAKPSFLTEHVQYRDRVGKFAAQRQSTVDDLSFRARSEHQPIERLEAEQRRREHKGVDDPELVTDHG